MTLTDAGPLIAIIDADEPDHDACVTALGRLALPLVTTWPAFTEAIYLLAPREGSGASACFGGSCTPGASLSWTFRRRLSTAARD